MYIEVGDTELDAYLVIGDKDKNIERGFTFARKDKKDVAIQLLIAAAYLLKGGDD